MVKAGAFLGGPLNAFKSQLSAPAYLLQLQLY